MHHVAHVGRQRPAEKLPGHQGRVRKIIERADVRVALSVVVPVEPFVVPVEAGETVVGEQRPSVREPAGVNHLQGLVDALRLGKAGEGARGNRLGPRVGEGVGAERRGGEARALATVHPLDPAERIVRVVIGDAVVEVLRLLDRVDLHILEHPTLCPVDGADFEGGCR